MCFVVAGPHRPARAHPAEAERIEILTRRIAAEPTSQRLHVARGAAYSHDGDFERALADLRAAEELGDPIAVAYELGLLRFRMGELEAAQAHFDRLLQHVPGHPRALERRARIHAERGDLAAAIADYDALLTKTTRPNPGLYVAVARLLAEHEQGGVEPALSFLDRGVERLGEIPQLAQVAVELELSRGRTDRAIERLERLEPILGEAPEWHVQLAEVLIRAERAGRARAHLAKASALLGELRETPARRALALRIEALRSALDSR